MTSSWLVLTLVFSSSLSASLFYVLSAKLLRETPLHAFFVLGITHLSAGLMLVPMAWGSTKGVSIPPSTFFYLAASIVLHFLARAFHFSALKVADVALVSPFAALTPVLAALFAWLWLGEVLLPQAALGMLVILVALFAIHRSAFTKSSQAGVLYAFLSAIPPALKVVFQKEAVILSNPWFFSAVVLLTTGTVVAVWDWRNFTDTKLLKLCLPLVFVSSFLALNTALFSVALDYDSAANVSGIARISIVMQGLLGYWLIRQDGDIWARLFWGFIAFVGTLLIAFA